MSFKHNLNPLCSSLEIILKQRRGKALIYFSKGEEVEIQKFHGKVDVSRCSESGRMYQIPLPPTPSDQQSALESIQVRNCLE